MLLNVNKAVVGSDQVAANGTSHSSCLDVYVSAPLGGHLLPPLGLEA